MKAAPASARILVATDNADDARQIVEEEQARLLGGASVT